MPVLLVRHGEAAVASFGDEARHLTLRGRVETLEVGRRLRALGHVATAIVASPLVRAVQTAEILASALGFDGVVTTDPAFVPEGDPIVALTRISTGTGLILVVCHEPIVRGIAAHLTRQRQFPPFRTSAAVLFDGSREILRVEP